MACAIQAGPAEKRFFADDPEWERFVEACLGVADAPPVKNPRIVIIANPWAGGRSRERAASVAALLRSAGAHVEAREATTAADISGTARSSECDAVIVAGGDGSLNAAIAGLLQRSLPRPVLGLIPSGTANVLAEELGLPHRPKDLAALFLSGSTRELRLGLANGRPFSLMVSAGFDAAVVEEVERGLKRRIGRLAYVVVAIKRLARPRPKLEAHIEGRVISCEMAIVTKAGRYGGRFRLAPAMSVLAPGLQLVVVKRLDPCALLRLGAMFIRGELGALPFVEIISVARAELRAPADVPAQLDGDSAGVTPVIVSECPATVKILCP